MQEMQMKTASLIERGLVARPTNQQLADMALAEDQAARRATKAGDAETAQQHLAESARLAALLN